MGGTLHIVGRWDPRSPVPRAVELAHANAAVGPETQARLLELFDPPPGIHPLDLALTERDVPEIIAALHWADEVHIHELDPQLGIEQLPCVKPEALATTTLVVHGPWIPATGRMPVAGAHMEVWPGPVRFDAAAQRCEPRPDTEQAPAMPPIDPSAAVLLPRAGGATPLQASAERWLAAIGIGHGVADADRAKLRLEIPALSRSEVLLEVIDENGTDVMERRELRRNCQAMILAAPSGDDWPRVVWETLVQGIPAIMVGDVPDPPPGVFVTGPDHPTQRCVACLRSWVSAWREGQAAPADVEAARAWALTRIG